MKDKFKEMGYKALKGGFSDRALHIFGLCNKITDYRLNNEFFTEWFIYSFPDNTYEPYIIEWINRFMKGTPFIHMDKERLDMYLKLIEIKYEVK